MSPREGSRSRVGVWFLLVVCSDNLRCMGFTFSRKHASDTCGL